MSTDVRVLLDDDELEFVKPIKVWGSEYGSVWQQYKNKKPQPWFLIGTGHHDNPVEIWYDDENGEYRLSSENKKSLKEYKSFIKYKKLNNVKLHLILSLVLDVLSSVMAAHEALDFVTLDYDNGRELGID